MMNRRATNEKNLLLGSGRAQRSYGQDIDMAAIKLNSERRKLLVLAGGALVTVPASTLALSLTQPFPTPVEYLVTRLALVIYTGRLKRQVWLPKELSNKLFTEGATIAPSELRLLSLSDVDINYPGEGFFEIEDAKPILKNKHALTLPLHKGLIYCYGYSHKEGVIAAEDFVGKDAIFLFDGAPSHGIGQINFPKPLYSRAKDGHWRDGLPIPIAELKNIIAMAKREGFVAPPKVGNLEFNK